MSLPPPFLRPIELAPSEVWLVGAGPGDPGLLTLAAWSALQQADVVVHDRLGCQEIIKHVPSTCRLIDVGKTSGDEAGSQDRIMEVLLKLARDRKRVVRLKGGDPYVFGRGREELDFLDSHGIPCHVIPGISSALSGPLLAGIPVTYRGEARSVLIGTGHTIEGLVATTQRPDTLVFLMAVGKANDLREELRRAGWHHNTPVAVIRDVSLPSQRTVPCTLDRFPETIEQEGLTAPCVVVIGAVARFAEKL